MCERGIVTGLQKKCGLILFVLNIIAEGCSSRTQRAPSTIILKSAIAAQATDHVHDDDDDDDDP